MLSSTEVYAVTGVGGQNAPINSMSGCPGVFGILIEVGDQKCIGFGGDYSCDESGGLAMVICNVFSIFG